LCYLTLEDLLMADEFVTPEGERGYQVMAWFKEHANSRQHRTRWVKRVAHLDIHLGGLADGGSARHNARVGIAAPPLVLPNCLLPRSGIQGGTYPTKESALLLIGQMQDLVSAALYLLKIGMVKVLIRAMESGSRAIRCSS